MASDDPGKYREKRHRFSKPYDRPKGFLQKVSDSVSGMITGSSTWLSKWLKNEENPASNQPGINRNWNPEPGPSNINRDRNPLLAESFACNYDDLLPGPSNRPPHILTARPTSNFSVANLATSKSELERRGLVTASSRDDHSEVSESSIDTGVDVSLIPRLDQGEYQEEILGLDDNSLESLRATLTRPSAPVPTTPNPEPIFNVRSKKRPRESELDQSSERDLNRTSLFSEKTEFSQPQSPALAAKRPRFNVSTIDTTVLADRSLLGDSSFKSSPFYPGRTAYGGASAYRKNNLIVRPLNQTPRVKVKVKPSRAASTNDSGLSEVAKRILDSLETLSTPISDAKKIPTPLSTRHRDMRMDSVANHILHSDSQKRSSAVPSNYMNEIQKQKSRNIYNSPTINSKSTPDNRKVDVFASTKSTILPGVSTPEIEEITPKTSSAALSSTTIESTQPFSKADLISTSQTKTSSVVFPWSTPSLTTEVVPSSTTKSTDTNTLSSHNNMSTFSFGNPSKTNLLPVIPKERQPEESLSKGIGAGGGGKIRCKITKNKEREVAEVDEPPTVDLPPVSLSITSLPTIKINFDVPKPSISSTSSTQSYNYTFSQPKILSTSTVDLPKQSTSLFTFSAPDKIGNLPRGGLKKSESSTSLMFNNPVSAFKPKLKTIVEPKKPVELKKSGSVCDILKINSSKKCIDCNNDREKSCDSCRTSKNSATIESNFDSFLKKTNEWECSVCLIRNKDEKEKCVACETPRPRKSGESKPVEKSSGFESLTKSYADQWECSVCLVRNSKDKSKCIACETPNAKASVSVSKPIGTTTQGFGTAFKMSSNEWECEVCMVRNKENVDSCVSCTTKRPGASSVTKPTEIKTSSTSSGFGDFFKKSSNEWDCSVCCLRNKHEATKCVACETPNPKAPPGSNDAKGDDKSSQFSFGIPSNKNSLPNSDSGFKLGMNGTSTSSSFSFGIPTKKDTSNDSPKAVSSTFKFGTSTTTTPSSEFKFGLSSNTSSSSTNNVDKITFGTSSNKSSESTTQKNIENNIINSVEKNNPINSSLNTHSKSISNNGNIESSNTIVNNVHNNNELFSFNKNSNNLPTIDSIKPTTNTTKESKNVFSFGPSKVNIEKPAFTFGSKNTDTPPTFNFGKPDAPKPSFNFGGNNTDNKTKAPVFSFGSSDTNKSLTSNFSFGQPNKTPAFGTNPTNTPSVPSFGNNKTESTPSVFAFGSQSAPQTNAFNFGSDKVPQVKTNFNFGNNNNNNNNNEKNGPVFAFGQTEEKKPNPFFAQKPAESFPAFQSGQANVPNSFNFNKAPVTAPTQAINANSAFVFGSGTNLTKPVAPTPSFGDAAKNPFNTAAPAQRHMEGRVIKRALRRNRDK